MDACHLAPDDAKLRLPTIRARGLVFALKGNHLYINMGARGFAAWSIVVPMVSLSNMNPVSQ